MKFNESNESEWVEAWLSFRQFISASCHSSSLKRQGFFSEWVQTGRAAGVLEKLHGLLHFQQNHLSSSALPAKPSRPEAAGRNLGRSIVVTRQQDSHGDARC